MNIIFLKLQIKVKHLWGFLRLFFEITETSVFWWSRQNWSSSLHHIKRHILSSQALYSTPKLNHLLLYTWLSTLLLDHRVHEILEHQGCLLHSHHLHRSLHTKARKCLLGRCCAVTVTSLVKAAYCLFKWWCIQDLKTKQMKTYRDAGGRWGKDKSA